MLSTASTAITEAEILRLVAQYDVNVEDVMLIALNLAGVDSQVGGNRNRMLIRLRSRPDAVLRVILASRRKTSPFSLTGDQILFHGLPFADVLDLEHDDIVLGYFRQDGRAMTLNSNARSTCTGCVFCPNTLEQALDPRLKALDDLGEYFDLVMRQQGWNDLRKIESVTLSTGCFLHEHPAVQHLNVVRSAMRQRGCNGRINFLSSVVRSDEAFDELFGNIAPFQLTLTVECFTNRDVLLKRSKADLTVEDMADILRRAKDRGLITTYTLVLGLDSLEDTLSGMEVLKPHVTRMPYINLYQAHNSFMDAFRGVESSQLEWYVRCRQEIERLFRGTCLCPTTWECYRGLWYFTYASRELPDCGPHGTRW